MKSLFTSAAAGFLLSATPMWAQSLSFGGGDFFLNPMNGVNAYAVIMLLDAMMGSSEEDIEPYYGVMFPGITFDADRKPTSEELALANARLFAVTNSYVTEEMLRSLGYNGEMASDIIECRPGQNNENLSFKSALDRVIGCLEKEDFPINGDGEKTESEASEKIVALCHELIDGAVGKGQRFHVTQENVKKYADNKKYLCFHK